MKGSLKLLGCGLLAIESLVVVLVGLAAQQTQSTTLIRRASHGLSANPAARQYGGAIGPVIGYAINSDTSPPLSEMPMLAPDRIKVAVREHESLSSGWQPAVHDEAVQSNLGPMAMPTMSRNFEGLNLAEGGGDPPDTTGDVGPNHYVQWVNVAFAVYDKSTGGRLYGPAAGNTIWHGFGGVCEETNHGDPLVNYDQLADRWVMSQFAFNTAGEEVLPPFTQCIAVSQTGDPLGRWHRYAFDIGSVSNPPNMFNDYGKIGVWPDAYFMSFSMFNGVGSLEIGFAAFDRARMMAGQR